MSRCSDSKLRASDSQDLGPLDSFSLPSEPPDIGNWYSSYVYESPELNTLDGFQDLDGSGETFVGQIDDALVDAPKKPSDGMSCNESDEFTRGKPSSLVTGSSESLSFPSEPPDIKQWFSSYIYESPTLDTLDFAISDDKESQREDGKLCNVQLNCKQDKEDVVSLVGAEENIELCSHRRHPNVLTKCTNLVKDPKFDYQSVSKDIHNVSPKPMSSTASQLNCDKVSDSSLSKRRSNNHDKDDDGNLHFSSTDERSPISSDVDKYTCSLDGESVHMSIGRIESVKEKVEKENLRRTSDLTIPKGDSSEWASHGKENDENGFISIRKKSCAVNDGTVTRRVRVELKRNQEKDATIVRKVLSEISNFSSGDSKGKWQCPQKNKPELGPPLKQLRLDQWFYRA